MKVAVRYGDKTAKNTIFIGATPEVATVMNLHLDAGRWINESDHTHNSNVVVLGHDTAETIFPSNVEAIGLVLYTRYVYYFQLAGAVLLVAMIVTRKVLRAPRFQRGG